MAALEILKPAGLHTSDNELSHVPDGAMVRASNCVIRSKGVVEPRRGLDLIPEDPGVTEAFYWEGTPHELFFYKDTFLALNTEGKLYRYDPAFPRFYLLGTFPAPAPEKLRMKSFEASSNFYFTTDRGLYVMDTDTNTTVPIPAGVPRALDPTGFVPLTAEPGPWLAPKEKVAYRVVWGTKDANGNLKFGVPSGRALYTNTSATDWHAPQLQIPVPEGIIQDKHFVRVYRSFAAPTLVTQDENGEDIKPLDPTDELFLAAEFSPTFADMADGTIEVIDYQPEDNLLDPLYTNPRTGNGFNFAKEVPPLAKDVTYWQGRSWFANTTGRHRFFVSILGCGEPDGITGGTTLTISSPTNMAQDLVLYFEETPLGPHDVQLTTTEDASINIERTTKALVDVINKAAHGNTSPVYAYYVAADDQSPGRIVLEAIRLDGPQFKVWTDKPSAYNPRLTIDATGAQVSENDTNPAGLMYSEYLEPEAVPLLNYFTVGSKNKAILRVVPLRDRLFVFKEDGIFLVSGEYPFRVDPLDTTVKLLMPDTAVAVANRVFALTDQGVVAVTDGGVQVVSRAIEQEIVALLNTNRRSAYAISYESERSYMLAVAYDSSLATKFYVYNLATSTWTTWDMVTHCGKVHPSQDKLYLARNFRSTGTTLQVERKDFNRSDYGDYLSEHTITEVFPTTNRISLSDVNGIWPGDQLRQVDDKYQLQTARVIGVYGPADPHVIVDDASGFIEGVAKVDHTILYELEFSAQHAGSPAQLKHWQAATFHFRKSTFERAEAAFASDLVRTYSYPDLTFTDPSEEAGWGVRVIPRNKRILVPREHQRASYLCVGFKINEVRAMWALNGVTVEVETTSERNSR